MKCPSCPPLPGGADVAAAKKRVPARPRAKAARPSGPLKSSRGPMVSRPLELDFPARRVGQPVLYELVRRFNLVPNIKRANITQQFGYMQLELKGRAQDMEAALVYLKKAGVTVAAIEKDVVES